MSLNTDLSKLQGLIKKFHRGTFNLRDYDNFIELSRSVSSQSALIEQARIRTVLVNRLLVAIKQMTNYAEKHQMPRAADYEELQLFRLNILTIDERHWENVFLISASTLGSKPIKAGIYHWQCPSAYGWEAPDIIKELTPEYLDELNFSNGQISEIIEAAEDLIIRGGALSFVSKGDKNKKYKERWPDVEEFSCWGLNVKSLDALDRLKADQLSIEFDVEITVDFENYRMQIFGPNDKVELLYEYLRQLKPYVVSFYYHSSGRDINSVKSFL